MCRKILPFKEELHFRMSRKKTGKPASECFFLQQDTEPLSSETKCGLIFCDFTSCSNYTQKGGENKGHPCPEVPTATLFDKGQKRGGEGLGKQEREGKAASRFVSVIILPVWGERELGGNTGFVWGGKHYLVHFHTLGVPLPTKIKPVGVLPWR